MQIYKFIGLNDPLLIRMRHPEEYLHLKDDTQLFCNDSQGYIVRQDKAALKLGIDNQEKKEFLESIFSILKQGVNREVLYSKVSKQQKGYLTDIIASLRNQDFFSDNSQLTKIKKSDLIRYSRQLNWLDINIPSQSAYTSLNVIFHKKICIFGLGSLGSLLLMELAAFGFRNFIIIDKDKVEASNLNRQILYTKKDINTPKVSAAKRWLNNFGKEIEVKAIKKDISSLDILSETIESCDLLILTADEPKGGIVLWTAELCAEKDIPWMRFSRMGIGPIYEKPTDACAACVLPQTTGILSEFQRLTNLSLNRRRAVIMSEVSLAISIAVHEVLLFILRGNKSLKNTVLTATPLSNSYALNKKKIRKHPRCVCAQKI